MRVVPLFLRNDWDDLGAEQLREVEAVQQLKRLVVEATEYFTGRQDWESLSELLDGSTLLLLRSGENEEAAITIKQRLQLPGLSLRERDDAIASLVAISFVLAEYDAAINVMSQALDALRPGEPVEYFGNIVGLALWILYMTGRWSEIPRFQQALDEAWKRVQEMRDAWSRLAGGYQVLLSVALAREDRAEIDANEAMLYRLSPEIFQEEATSLRAVYRDEDFSQITAFYEKAPGDTNGSDVIGFILMLFSEHGLEVPVAIQNQLKRGGRLYDDMTLHASNIAQALLDDDNEALAHAINEAEEHQLVVHSARMRIVLAKRTGDRSQLERARPVLERLEDRLFLRKLREVDELLQPSTSDDASV